MTRCPQAEKLTQRILSGQNARNNNDDDDEEYFKTGNNNNMDIEEVGGDTAYL